MWLHSVSVKKNVQTYISPKLCLTPEIKSKHFRTGECVGIGQTSVIYLSGVSSSIAILLQKILTVSIFKIQIGTLIGNILAGYFGTLSHTSAYVFYSINKYP